MPPIAPSGQILLEEFEGAIHGTRKICKFFDVVGVTGGDANYYITTLEKRNSAFDLKDSPNILEPGSQLIAGFRNPPNDVLQQMVLRIEFKRQFRNQERIGVSFLVRQKADVIKRDLWRSWT